MDNHDLQLVLRSKAPLIALETYDEPRALDLLGGFYKHSPMAAWRWSVTEGLRRLGFGASPLEDEKSGDPAEVLRHIRRQHRPAAWILCDFHPYLERPEHIRLLKDLALGYGGAGHKIILISHRIELPPELSRYSASANLSLPDEDEILAIVRDEAREWASQNGASRIKTDNVTLRKLVSNLRGLPHQDVRRLAHGAIADDGAITESDLPEVTRAKFDLMDMEGVLHFEYSTAQFGDVAGLNNLKQWLEDRRALVTGDGVNASDQPRGVLLFGVQGGGKSLAAKAIAGVWGLPLLRLDMAALFNKYIGETERNLREALKLADLMSPCVLWMDELEKGMASGDSDNGTPKRLLGTLLTWMAERKSQVFMVATSNDISCLPPELMRKGRFDEIFFVDLPDTHTREAIFRIHLRKRGCELADFDLPTLAAAADGFTGAEIEQAVVSATYAAMARDVPLDTAAVINAVRQTQPLSVVMAESMAQLRDWAKQRAVFA